MVVISEKFEQAWERERERREIAELERIAAMLILRFGTHVPA
jgi:hypothetical protein